MMRRENRVVHYGHMYFDEVKPRPLCNTYSSKPNWVVTTDFKEATCKTCVKIHQDKIDQQLRQIDYAVQNEVMSAEEVLDTLNAAFDDAKRMSERCNGISMICTLVQTGFFSREELIDHFKNAIVKVTMDE